MTEAPNPSKDDMILGLVRLVYALGPNRTRELVRELESEGSKPGPMAAARAIRWTQPDWFDGPVQP